MLPADRPAPFDIMQIYFEESRYHYKVSSVKQRNFHSVSTVDAAGWKYSQKTALHRKPIQNCLRRNFVFSSLHRQMAANSSYR